MLGPLFGVRLWKVSAYGCSMVVKSTLFFTVNFASAFFYNMALFLFNQIDKQFLTLFLLCTIGV